MRIVHINTQDVEGGAARMALGLAQEQRRRGHDASLLVGRKNLTGDMSFRFDSSPNEELRFFCEAAKLPYFHFQGSHNLPNHPQVKDADVVHVHNIHFDYFNPFSLSFLSHAKPTVWTMHDLYPVTGLCMHPGPCPSWHSGCFPCHRSQLNDPHQKLENGRPTNWVSPGPSLTLQWKKKLYEHCHLRVVCPSHWMHQQVHNSILAETRVETIHNGVDTATFRPLNKAEAKQKLGITINTPVIGAMAVQGALDNPLKGGHALRRILTDLTRTYPNIILLNVGSDKENPSPRILNIPYVHAPEDLAWVYAAMDVFVHAAEAESFCLVAVEAMSCGVPVAAFDTGPLPELVHHGHTGLLSPPADAAALADSVHRILSDPFVQQNYGHNARERACKFFSFTQTNEAYLQVYASEIEIRQTTPPLVKPFDLDSLPALLKTSCFLRAESQKIGKDLAGLVIEENMVGAFLGHLSQELFDQLAPVHRKAQNTRQVFSLREQGRLEDALLLLNELIHQWPDDMALMRTKGVTLGLLGRDDEAIATFEQCLAADPPQTDVWLNMFDIFLRSEKIERCEHALETFAAIDPNLKGFNHRLGLLRQKQRDYRGAIKAFLMELRLHGSQGSIHPLRGAWKKRHPG